MRPLCTIIQTLMGTMICALDEGFDWLDVAAQFIRDHHTWFSKGLNQTLQKSPRCLCIAVFLNQNVQCIPVRINGTPQPVFLTIDLDDNLIQMPFVRWARPVTFDAIGEMSTKTVHPKPDGFAANIHAALGKEIFYIRSAQCKAVIRPHRVGNDLSRKTETFKTGHAIWYFHTHPINQIPMEINLAIPFTEMLSHYLFDDRYGRPGKGNDKGNVEGLVGWSRRNMMVPLPEFADIDSFNVWLEEQCRKRQSAVLHGHKETIGQRLQRDLAAMRSLPSAPYEACAKATGRVSSQSLVRYKTNDYSVPSTYGFRDVTIRAFVDVVEIGCGGAVIARHPRCYEREQMVFNPVHYFALLERKPGALDQAAPLADWEMPEELQTLRRLLEARQVRQGRCEFVQVLRLLESFDLPVLCAAVRVALQKRAIAFDAIKHLVLCQVECRPARLDLSLYPYLPRAAVQTTKASSYMALLSEGAS